MSNPWLLFSLCLGLSCSFALAATLRQRRFLKDRVTAENVDAARLYIDPARETLAEFDFFVRANANYIPTTAAQDWIFFNLTNANARSVTSILGDELEQRSCIIAAQLQKCITSDCKTKSYNDVPQKAYSWNPVLQRFVESGPGGSKSSTIRGNGVRSIAHFSPDGNNDFFIPSSSIQDLSAGETGKPTTQFASIWSYSQEAGYSEYQTFAWYGSGTRFVLPFQLNGEQYILHTSFVEQEYEVGELVSERFYGLENQILKWSARTVDRWGRVFPYGHFLHGGDAKLSSTDGFFYSPELGNGGGNTFQILRSLKGVVHAEFFSFNDLHFIAFAEYIDDRGCQDDKLPDGFRECWQFETSSSLYLYDESLLNGRGDCINFNEPTGCQTFQGEFVFFQDFATKGAQHVHFFEIQTTGEIMRLLAFSEAHTNKLLPTKSSIYKWNGRAFGLFQTIDTLYASKIESFRIQNQTFLVVYNRGCPDLPRATNSSAFDCNKLLVGRARIWMFDVFGGTFKQLEESSIGTLHPLGFSSTAQDVLEGFSFGPSGGTVFQLPSFDQISLGPIATYIAVANSQSDEIDLVGDCPSTSFAKCSAIPNMFKLSSTSEMGLLNVVAALQNQVTELTTFRKELEQKLIGGDGLLSNLKELFGPTDFLFGLSAADSSIIDGHLILVLGFDRAVLPTEECILLYTNETSDLNANACPHLESSERFPYSAEECQNLCTLNAATHFRTETKVVEIELVHGIPTLKVIQSIPSLSVSDVKLFTQDRQITATQYSSCIRNPQSCPIVESTIVLAIVNQNSSCSTTTVARDPLEGIHTYIWSSKMRAFVNRTILKPKCIAKSTVHFQTHCQKHEDYLPFEFTCGNFLAISEYCPHHFRNETLDIPFRVSFATLVDDHYELCQPYADVGDPRNKAESPCRQPLDAFRVAGIVHVGDEQTYDFPDILPMSLQARITDDLSGYFAQLNPHEPSHLELTTATAKKYVYYRGDDGKTQPIGSTTGFDATNYHTNGRFQYEQLLIISFDVRNVGPQVFGLQSLHAKSSACASRHATLPRRREFRFVQALDASGSRSTKTFTRLDLNGNVKSYLIVPERHTRIRFAPNVGFVPGGQSSLFVNSVCNEFSKYTASRFNILGGIREPDEDILVSEGIALPEGDTRWCPYSTNIQHFEAWEAYYNFYHPVDGCRGKRTITDGPSYAVQQRFYNAPPPAELLGNRQVKPEGPFTWARDPMSPKVLSSQKFSARDFADLFRVKDSIFVNHQDIAAYAPNAVAVHDVCGFGGRLLLNFANAASNANPNVDPPRAKKMMFTWNDRYGIESDGVTCSESGALTVKTNLSPYQYPQLGCFESVILETAVNHGEAVSSFFFEISGTLVAMQLNRDISSPCSGQLAGSIFSLGVSLELFGGMQCKQGSLNVKQIYAAMTNEFVSLSGDQIITGAKTFNQPAAFQSGIIVDGAARIETLDVTKKILSAGTYNGLYLENSIQSISQSTTRQAEILNNLEVRVCQLEVEEFSVQRMCNAISLKTSCFPKPSLTFDQVLVLNERFKTFLQVNYPVLEIVYVRLDLFMNHANVVVRSNQTMPLHVNASQFYDSEMCTTQPPQATPDAEVQIALKIGFPGLACSVFSIDVQIEVKRAISQEMGNLNVRLSDIQVANVECGPSKLNGVIFTSVAGEPEITKLLQQETFWGSVYERLLASRPDIFPDLSFMLEYLPGMFVPDDSGSGSGSKTN